MAALQIRLFGGFEARLGSGEALSLKGRKTQALVACLALPPGEPRTRDELVALLWSDRGDQQARSSLRQSLSELRKALGDAERSPLIAGRDAVSLDADAVEVDVTEFERLIDEGTPAALEQAAALYRGDLLDGIGVHDPAFEDWLRDERQRLHERACEALSRLLDHQAQDTERAIATARRLLALDPLRETVHRALVRLYAGKGERALALKQYQACRDVLAAELGLSPEPETERLAEEIRTGATGTGEDLGPVPEPRAPEPEPLPLLDKPSIAVLPFVNISGDPEQEYFADGITEDIITELSRFRSLFVIARHSSFHYKGQSPKVQDIGRELGVQYVVEGGVRKAGNRVRITAQLVEATTGNHLWAARYDRELEDIFAVQDEVAETVAANLGRSLRDAALVQARTRPASNLTAYDHLLRGRAAWWSGQQNEAFEHLERALAADPDYAAAHAWLALQYTYNGFYGTLGLTTEELARSAWEHANAALRLDEWDAFVHMAVSMAFTFTLGGDSIRGLRHSDVAIALNPHDFEIMYCRSYVLAFHGRFPEAFEWLDKARRLNPITTYLLAEAYCDFYYQMGEYEKSLNAISGQRDIPMSMHLEIASANVHLGRLDEAASWIAAFERQRPTYFDTEAYLRLAADRFPRAGSFEDRIEILRQAGLQI